MNILLVFYLILALASLRAVAMPFFGEAQGVEKEKQTEFIGVATMKDDGTIVLRLRAKSRQGGVGGRRAPWCIRRLTPIIKTLFPT